MKLINKITILLPLIVFMLFVDCSGNQLPPRDGRIHIKFNQPNFYDNWEYYNSPKNYRVIDRVTIEFEDEGLFTTPIKLNERITFNVKDNIHTPRLPDFNKNYENKYFASRPDQGMPSKSTCLVTSKFIDNFLGENLPLLRERLDLTNVFKANTVNDITFEYYLDQNNHLDFSAKIDEQERASIEFFGNKLRNLNPDVIRQKESENSIYNSINFVIMAEGYRADQISFFSDYAKEAASPENFGFNREDWRNVNVFSFETISPEAFNLPFNSNDKIQSFFEYKPGKGTINYERMKQVISNTTIPRKTYLYTFDIDAYIIFVNTGHFITSYAESYLGSKMGYRNDKPVHYLIIYTQVNRFKNDSDFLDYVHINRIGDLLKEIRTN